MYTSQSMSLLPLPLFIVSYSKTLDTDLHNYPHRVEKGNDEHEFYSSDSMCGVGGGERAINHCSFCLPRYSYLRNSFDLGQLWTVNSLQNTSLKF